MNTNVLMVSHVSVLFSQPHYHAWLRCSGTVGDAAFKELCDVGLIPVYVETSSPKYLVPLRRDSASSPTNNPDDTIIISIRAYERISPNAPHHDYIPIDRLHVTYCTNLTLASVLVGEHTPVNLILSIEGLSEYEMRGLALPNHFLSRNTRLNQLTFLPSSSSQRQQPHWSVIKEIPVGYLDWCTELPAVDLTPFSHVTEIRTWFLNCCGGLKTLDVSPLCNITTIPSWFMHRCDGLNHLNLSPLVNVHHIQAKFLNGCVGLQSIVLPPHVNKVDGGFMSQCSNLTTLDLSPLKGVTAIQEDFLSSCTSLKHLDLTPLVSLITIGSGFGIGCTGLESADLSAQGSLVEIGSAFLSRCSSLTDVVWKGTGEGDKEQWGGIGGRQLRKIGKSFMADCKRLKVVDFSSLENVENVGKNFMLNCELDRAAISQSKRLREAFSVNLKDFAEYRNEVFYFKNLKK